VARDAHPRPGKTGRRGDSRPTVTKNTAETIVPVTMILRNPRTLLGESGNATRPTVTARLYQPLLLLAAWAACCWIAGPAAAADKEFDPTSVPPVLSDSDDALPPVTIIQDRIVLDPEPETELLPGPVGSVLSESDVPVLSAGDGSMVVEPPRILDVSSRGADGMLLDDFELDEMPFEASSGQWFNDGGWYYSAESLWLSRSRNQRVVIGEEPNPDPESRLRLLKYTTVSEPFNVSPGARVTLGRNLGRDYLDRDRSVEFVYYGGLNAAGKNGFNSLTSVPTLVSPLARLAAGFNFANTYNTTLSSDFNSMEINYKLARRLGRDQLVMSPAGNWTKHAERGFLPALILGVRVANENENFSFTSRRLGVAPSVYGGDYTIATQNWLFGLNLGGELISRNEFYYWGLRGRAAPCLSWAADQQRALGVNTTNFPVSGGQTPTNFAYAASGFGPGFIGDLTLLAGWNIKPNLSLQIGYDFLWIAGIATATRQFNLDNRDQYPLDAGGQVLYNGVSFGLNGSW
jgi:hypothetical protein